MSFQEAASLITAPPGGLIYHLTVAMAMAVAFSLSQVYRSAYFSESARQWLLASGILLTIRIALLGLAGLAWLGRIQPATLPVFDRFASLMGVVLLAWVLYLPRPELRQYGLFLGVGAGLLGLVATPFVVSLHPAGTPFNHTYADAGWSIVFLLFALTAAYALLAGRPPAWDLALAPFALLVAGGLLHIAVGPSDQDMAGFVRLAEMAAYPLFAVLAARIQVQETLGAPGGLAAEEQPSAARSLMDKAAQFSQQLTARDPLELSFQASGLLAHQLDIGLCLLFSGEHNKEQFELTAGYLARQERHLTGTWLDVGQMPVLAAAIRGRRTLHINQEHPLPDLETLSHVLGVPIDLPAILIPLRAHRQHMGALLLAAPRDQLWPPQHLQLALWAASFLATRFFELQHGPQPGGVAAGVPASALAQAQQRARELERQNQTLRQRLQALEAQASSPPPDTQQLQAQLTNAKQTIRRLQQELSELRFQATAPQPRAPKAKEQEPPQLKEMQSQLHLALQELAEARQRLQQVQQETQPAQAEAGPQPDVEALVRIAHQLRQPTSTILGYTDVLLGESVGLLGAMQRQFLERVQSATRQIGELLNELTRAAALEVGDIALLPEPVDVAHCLDEAITQLSERLRQKGITLRVAIPEELPPVMGDHESLTSIAAYLLQNAIGATPSGGQVTVRADAQSTEEGDFLLLSVGDQGPGVPAEALPRVFQMSYGGKKGAVPGLGTPAIDLATTRTMVEMLGGRIWVDSEEGAGSTFTVLLPCSRREEESPAAQ